MASGKASRAGRLSRAAPGYHGSTSGRGVSAVPIAKTQITPASTVILTDSSVLVALCDKTDPLARRAVEQLRSLNARRLRITPPVLTETWHLLQGAWLRRILIEWLIGIGTRVACPVEERGAIDDVWRWLEKYEDHEPDFTDAYLVIASADKRSSIWTFDTEFVHVWRHLDGSRVRLAFPISRR